MTTTIARERRATKRYGGLCNFCNQEFSRRGIARHLASCKARPTGTGRALHLGVEHRDWGDFWLHVEASGATTLAQIDSLLRGTWLECCGHLSRFEIDGTDYQSTLFEDSWGPKPMSMNMLPSARLVPSIFSVPVAVLL